MESFGERQYVSLVHFNEIDPHQSILRFNLWKKLSGNFTINLETSFMLETSILTSKLVMKQLTNAVSKSMCPA